MPGIRDSRVDPAVDRWSVCCPGQESRVMVYPSGWGEFVYLARIRLCDFWHDQVHGGAMDRIQPGPIDRPYDGGIFADPTPLACADRPGRVHVLGEKVAQRALDQVRDQRGARRIDTRVGGWTLESKWLRQKVSRVFRFSPPAAT